MTTTVTIKHDGPDHHDVEISVINPLNGVQNKQPIRLIPGQSHTISLWDTQGLRLTEVPKQR